MFKEEYLKILAPPKDRFEFNFLLKPPTIAAIISFIVLAIFSGVLTAEFVMWDDDVSIYVFSLLSHAIGITYVATLFIFDIFLFKRIGGERGWWRTQATKKVLLEKIILANPAVLISVITVIVRVKSAGGWAPPVSLAEFGILDRAMQSVYIISYYLYRPFYPSDLAPVYTTLISFEPLSWPFLVRALILLLLSSILFVFGTMYQFKAKMTGSVKVVV